ncbi:hypothetical protein CK203_013276 [Vitis vinifera]|uniref:Uncharacterized protein n=1 Tax=Vitis vinifera TaxID=29760 RepID=A0A438JQ33_VITVI|nr:hypothetical protein CK203_013276 [Vitis vinifera]
MFASGVKKFLREMGIVKSICFAIPYPTWACLLLPVLLCFVANLEFLDPSSSVYPVYGLHSGIPLCDDWDTQTTNRSASYRLSFIGFKREMCDKH